MTLSLSLALQAAVAQQAQHAAVAESRLQMAAAQAALEEQVLALQEELDLPHISPTSPPYLP